MENSIEPIVQVRDWSIDRIHHLADTGDAVAIAEEFDDDKYCDCRRDLGDKEWTLTD